jgi:hypothetical protein
VISTSDADKPGRLVIRTVGKPLRDAALLSTLLVDDLQVDTLALVLGLVPSDRVS